MQVKTKVVSLMLLAVTIMAGCSTAPSSRDERAELRNDAQQAIRRFRNEDPSISRFFDSSVAYAVFPTVGKGGLGVGGAYGKGVLYENGAVVGYCDLSQATIGLQAGGQSYREIIFFQTRKAVDDFKAGRFALSAQASAVAVNAGAAATADYSNGVAVFVGGEAGLMAEASVGGQKFSYVPADMRQ